MNKHDTGNNDVIHNVVSLAESKQISYAIVIPSFNTIGNLLDFNILRLREVKN